MKHKAISKKTEVKNQAFIEAVTSSTGERNKMHLDIIDWAKRSGVLLKLTSGK